MALAFTPKDLLQIQGLGISPDQVLAQVEEFQRGVTPIQLQAPCTPGGGVRVLSEKEIEGLTPLFEQAQGAGRTMKFVPASGAASRMFRELHVYLRSEGTAKPDPSVEKFFENIDRFAFADILWEHSRKKGLDRKALANIEGKKNLLRELLGPKGLNYEKLPKGLIPFHAYPDHVRTAFEEQLVESLQYTRDGNGLGRIHFTLNREWVEPVKQWFQGVCPRYEVQGVKSRINYSVQKSATHTIAVDPENRPFRLKDDTLFFRPGGHGALLENLQECGGDIVFIKNIDNVVHDRWKPATYRYKEALGGLLVKIQSQVFSYLQELDAGTVAPGRFREIQLFAETELGFRTAAGVSQKSLKEFLHRPLRVCGVVRNLGEPGGAPFWVRGENGEVSLQLVESSQVDRHHAGQWEIFRGAAYFNPVDLVCGLKDHRDTPFDLKAFRDDKAYFISEKTHGGRPLKALELPGLWNGGMAFWNTLFVEVPVETFAPVKTVNDLLRSPHQP